MTINKQIIVGEWRQIARDPLLKWLFLFPIVIAAAYRFGIPELSTWVMNQWQIDLSAYYILLLSILPALIPSIIGMVTGFSLLDQRDEGSLNALLVTPMQLEGYLRFKMAVPMLLSLPLNIICLWFADLVDLSLAQLLLASISPLLLAPFIALLLAVVASNKVEGLALTKVFSTVIFPPVLAWFFPAWWNWLFGLLPTWWPMKAFWTAIESLPSAVLVVALGLLVQMAWIVFFWRKLTRRSWL